MYSATPNQTVASLVEAINNGDVNSAISLYETGASFAAQPTEIVSGSQNILEALSMMISMKPRLTTLSAKVIEADGVALYQSLWKMVFVDESGQEVTQNGCSADILRFHPQFGWRILVDNPWGSSILNG